MDSTFDSIFNDFIRGAEITELQKRWPNFLNYPKLIQECLELNEKIQALGRS